MEIAGDAKNSHLKTLARPLHRRRLRPAVLPIRGAARFGLETSWRGEAPVKKPIGADDKNIGDGQEDEAREREDDFLKKRFKAGQNRV
jgi:hypothetical protein